ncbi:MAG: hypothetical protein KGL42_07940 [Betaproteobacteria bacterium]|nr:hypothetical protein [Betaproteobacteria bacterium]
MSPGNADAAASGEERGAKGAKQNSRRGDGNADALPNTSSARRARLLAALRRGPITTIRARAELDVLGVAQRTLELRKAGHQIATLWKHEPTESGRLHRVALYALLQEAQS